MWPNTLRGRLIPKHHLGDRVFGRYDRAGLLKHLVDALHGGAGDDDHDKHHAQHHQAGKDLHGVGEQAGQLTMVILS